MRVAQFVTCLVDLLRLSVGFSAIRLLEAGGCTVCAPHTQTCCGQPAFNSEDRLAASALARKTIAEFEGYDYVVVPSDACADQLRNEYLGLFAGDRMWRARAERLAAQVYKLSDFLVSIIKLSTMPGEFSGRVSYHDSFSGLSRLGIRDQPRALLAGMSGLTLREMPASGECSGFGGSFSISFGELSASIIERKCVNVQATGADAVVGGDLGCLMNIEGRMRRRGDDKTRVLHVAEVLSGADGKLN